MAKQPYCIVFDIGGTSLRAAVLTPAGRLLGAPLRCETPNIWNQPRTAIHIVQRRLVDRVIAMTRELRAHHARRRIRHVGISMAGAITAHGVVRHSSGLWGNRGHGFSLLQQLQRRLPLRWHVVNDMTAAAAYYGSLPTYRRFRWIAVVTISSGVGAKVFDTLRNEVLIDPAGISGELGHVRVDFAPDALRCECGTRGDLQALCSGRSAERVAARLARQELPRFRRSRLWRITDRGTTHISTFHIEDGIKGGDRLSLEVLRQITEPLARSLALLVGTVGIERVIVMGGFALALGPHYLRMLQAQLVRVGCAGRTVAEIRRLVCLGQRGGHHGLIGAGLLTQQRHAY